MSEGWCFTHYDEAPVPEEVTGDRSMEDMLEAIGAESEVRLANSEVDFAKAENTAPEDNNEAMADDAEELKDAAEVAGDEGEEGDTEECVVPEENSVLTPEQEQEFGEIKAEVIESVHERFFELFGNPEDTLSGDILGAEAYLIAFIERAKRTENPKIVESALATLKAIHRYWDLNGEINFGDVGDNEFIITLYRIKKGIFDTEPEDTAPEKAEPEDTAPEKAEPGDTAPEKAEPGDTAAKKTESKEKELTKKQTKKVRSGLKNRKSIRIYEAVKDQYKLADGNEAGETALKRLQYLDAVVEFARNKYQGITTVTEAQLHFYAFMAEQINPVNSGDRFRDLVYEGIPELAVADEMVETIVEKALAPGNSFVIFYLARIVDYYKLVDYLNRTDQQLSQMTEFVEFARKTQKCAPDTLLILEQGFSENSELLGNEQSLRMELEAGIEEIIKLMFGYIENMEIQGIPDERTFASQFAMVIPSWLMGGQKFVTHWETYTEDREDKRLPDFQCVYCRDLQNLALVIRDYAFDRQNIALWRDFILAIYQIAHATNWKYIDLSQLIIVKEIMDKLRGENSSDDSSTNLAAETQNHLEKLVENYLIAIAFASYFLMRDIRTNLLTEKRINPSTMQSWDFLSGFDSSEKLRFFKSLKESLNPLIVSFIVRGVLAHSFDLPFLLQLQTRDLKSRKITTRLIGDLEYTWEAVQPAMTVFTKSSLAAYRKRMSILGPVRKEKRKKEAEELLEVLGVNPDEGNISIISEVPADLAPYEAVANSFNVSPEVAALAVESVVRYVVEETERGLQTASEENLAFAAMATGVFDGFWHSLTVGKAKESSEFVEKMKMAYPALQSMSNKKINGFIKAIINGNDDAGLEALFKEFIIEEIRRRLEEWKLSLTEEVVSQKTREQLLAQISSGNGINMDDLNMISRALGVDLNLDNGVSIVSDVADKIINELKALLKSEDSPIRRKPKRRKKKEARRQQEIEEAHYLF